MYTTRIVKRTNVHGRVTYVVKRRWWVDVGGDTENEFNTLAEATKYKKKTAKL